VTVRPTLLSSCARAATAAEARFRIDYPTPGVRVSLVIALDPDAAVLVSGLAARRWLGGHFLDFDRLLPGGDQDSGPADAVLRDPGGAATLLSAELDDADIAVMIATSAASAEAAAVVGDACAGRLVMSAGLVVDDGTDPGKVRGVVASLRPNAMVLVVLKSSDDIPEILKALRV
jgi:hypothetical protein